MLTGKVPRVHRNPVPLGPRVIRRNRQGAGRWVDDVVPCRILERDIEGKHYNSVCIPSPSRNSRKTCSQRPSWYYRTGDRRNRRGRRSAVDNDILYVRRKHITQVKVRDCLPRRDICNDTVVLQEVRACGGFVFLAGIFFAQAQDGRSCGGVHRPHTAVCSCVAHYRWIGCRVADGRIAKLEAATRTYGQRDAQVRQIAERSGYAQGSLWLSRRIGTKGQLQDDQLVPGSAIDPQRLAGIVDCIGVKHMSPCAGPCPVIVGEGQDHCRDRRPKKRRTDKGQTVGRCCPVCPVGTIAWEDQVDKRSVTNGSRVLKGDGKGCLLTYHRLGWCGETNCRESGGIRHGHERAYREKSKDQTKAQQQCKSFLHRVSLVF